MRTGIGSYILIILLVLLIFGVISLGDVLSVVFYIIMGFILLVLAGVLFFRYRLGRLKRRMEQEGNASGTYTAGRASGRQSKRAEGEIRVEQTPASKTKVVSNQVGDYVEYEEIEETQD